MPHENPFIKRLIIELEILVEEYENRIKNLAHYYRKRIDQLEFIYKQLEHLEKNDSYYNVMYNFKELIEDIKNS